MGREFGEPPVSANGAGESGQGLGETIRSATMACERAQTRTARPARRPSKAAGSAVHELYLFFTVSLPNFVVLRTRTPALRGNFTFSLPHS